MLWYKAGKMYPNFSYITVFLKMKVRKRAKIRNRYNQAPQLTRDTNRKDFTNESKDTFFLKIEDQKLQTLQFKSPKVISNELHRYYRTFWPL